MPEDGTYSSKINFSGDGDVTINGGTFEVGNRHFIQCSGNGSSPYTKQFTINGGTFYLKSTSNWDIGRFYYCKTPVINGGVFKTDGTALSFAAAWNAGSAVTFNGGYFSAPLRQSTNADNTTPTFKFPSGYSMSSDTLGNLTGDAGEYADYYWVTKSTTVTYDVNHSDSDPSNTATYTGTAYTTYASDSMLASSNKTSYTAYNNSIPYRSGNYKFKGWAKENTASEGALAVSGLAANAKLYAVWADEATTYNIAYDLNGGSGTVPATEANKTVSDWVQMPSSVGISRAGYVFDGWALSADADAPDYASKQKASVADMAQYAEMVGEAPTITIYAVWSAKEAITFSNQTVDYTGSPIAYDVTQNDKGVTDGFTVTYYSSDKYTEVIGSNEVVEPQYYYVIIERAEDATYAAVNAKAWLKISPIGRLSVSVSSYDKPYDGEPHTCTVSVKVDGKKVTPESINADIRYGTSYNNYTMDAAPTYTDVCSYKYVYVSVSAPGYETAKDSSYVNITKAKTTVSLSGSDTVDYDGSGHSLSATVINSKNTVITGAVPTLTYYTDEAYTNALDGEPVDAGTYYVKAELEGTTNYVAGEATGVLTINKADNPLAFDQNTGEKHINAEPFTPELTGYTDGAAFTSSDEQVATVDDSGKITVVGAGTATITAAVAESANYKAATAAYTLTVTDHTWNDGVITKEASCTETGEKTYTCSVEGCGAERTEEIPMHDHSYSTEWTADETSHWNGCTVCGSKANEAPHTYGEDWICDDDGHWHVCSVCGKKADVANHTFGEWTVSKDATETTTGEKQRTCSVCGYVETEEIPVIGVDVQTQIVQTNLTDVPEGLKDTKFNTVEAITAELTRVAVSYTGYTAENTVVSDVRLQISTDGGETWFDATEENFPASGITIVLPYPEGTGKDTHDFVVTHMFTVTSERLGTTAGKTETPAVKKLDNGIQVTLKGLSPVSISWKTVSASTDKPGSSTDKPTENNPNTGAQSPQTGDSSNVGLWVALLAISAFGVGAMLLYGRKRRTNR